MMKHSKQRECILDYLKSVKTHPTAETVYLNIKENNPKIGLATVYRNLSLLADMGEILRIPSAGGADRFDADIRPHNHFYCVDCESVIDLEMESIAHIDELAAKTFGGKIYGHSIMFNGVCPDCLNKANQELA